MRVRIPARFLAMAVVLAGMAAVGGTAAGADADVEAALNRFFRAEAPEEAWFAPSFLAAVPIAQLGPARQQVVGSLGEYLGVRRVGDHWEADYERGIVPTYASLDAEGRFVGLRILLPRARAASLEEAVRPVDDLVGETSLLVRRDGEILHGRNVDAALAVGSAFKLVILRALQLEVASGRRAWSDVVELDDAGRSLPSGFLREWPTGAPLTLQTLATLMISQSDNTATDVLLHELGREVVEASDPSGRNRPFLATGEAFRLKNPDNAAMLERWRNGNEAERRQLLAELPGAPMPEVSLFLGEPVALDVEWFFRPGELCDLIAAVAELDLMGVNPGVIAVGAWSRVAFKGGSEPGVLNLTTWARDEEGHEVCVCVTQNADEAIDIVPLSTVVTSIFAQLASDQD